MSDFGTVLVVSILSPFFVGSGSIIGGIALSGLKEAGEHEVWLMLIVISQSLIYGLAALAIIFAPILAQGVPGFLGMLLGGTGWYLFWQKRDI